MISIAQHSPVLAFWSRFDSGIQAMENSPRSSILMVMMFLGCCLVVYVLISLLCSVDYSEKNSKGSVKRLAVKMKKGKPTQKRAGQSKKKAPLKKRKGKA
ncbi:MAG: hypothetical protein IPK22_05295 [Verrucomicrobiaceae bacterium]|nr:hypothetical protein [Verrucomicrobiaceae bacterium]